MKKFFSYKRSSLFCDEEKTLSKSAALENLMLKLKRRFWDGTTTLALMTLSITTVSLKTLSIIG
jgi:hypothetical protein